jgi:hypothetical protein
METKGLQVPAQNKRDQGQAIILVAFLMVLLLAITGVAIDGGGLYFLWRDVRNATDAAAIASVYTLCVQGEDSGWQEAAIFSAEESGFFNDYDGTEPHDDHDGDGNITIVEVDHPDAAEFPGKDPNYLVEVTITAEKTAFFIQVLGQDELIVSASTVAECSPGSPIEEEGDPPEQTKFAFDIRSPRGTCTGEPAFAFAGTGNAIYGDIYINDTVMGGGPTTPGANPIYGDLFVGAPETTPPNLRISHLREETTSGPLYDTAPDTPGIDWAQPANPNPNPFPWNNWSDLMPGGSVQATLGSNYRLLACSAGGKVEPYEWQNHYTSPGSGIMKDGFYVPDYAGTLGYACQVNQQLQIPGGLRGRVTIISNGKIETSGSGTQLTPYWEGVLFASSLPRTDPQSCKNGDHSIRLSGSGETLQGDIIVASNGMIHANGNNSTYESCFSAWAVNLTGNNSNYFCQPGGAPPESSFPSISIIR